MGCGASKDAASAPGPECCGGNSKKKKRNKETESEAHQEEAESRLLLSSSQKQSEEFQEERYQAEIGLRVQVDLEQYAQVQTAVTALPLVLGSPEEIGVPQARFILPSPAEVIADSKGSSPSAAGAGASTAKQVHSLVSAEPRTSSPPAPAPQPAWQSRTPTPGNSAPQSRQASGRSTPVELKPPASNIPVELEAALQPVGGSRQTTPLVSYPAAESRLSSGRNTYPELKAPSPSSGLHSRQSPGRNELKTPDSRLSSGRSTPVELKASYPAVETRESSGRSTPLELKASLRQSSGRSTPVDLKPLHPAATRQSSGWSISESNRQPSGQSTPAESNAEPKPPSSVAGSAPQSNTSSPRDILHSSKAPSTVGAESKNPTPRQVRNDLRNLSRTPSPTAAGPAQSVPSTRTTSPGQSAPASPGPLASPSPGHSAPASPAASAQKIPASPQSVPTSMAPPSIPTSRTASPAEPKAGRTSPAQPNEGGTRNAFTLPPAEFKRTPSTAPSETSRTSSPRIPDFKGQLDGRTPPAAAPAVPKSRTPSPAPAQVPELREPAPLSQEESLNQFSSCPSSPVAELQKSVTAPPLARSSTSSPQYTDEQRKQLLADLVEKISRSSSRTSVPSLKDSRSSSKSPAPSQQSKASSNSPAISCKESRASSATSSRKTSTVFVDEDLSATAASALQAIVNSVASGLEARDEDDLSAHDEVKAAESARDVPDASTRAAPPREVDEGLREKTAEATEKNDEHGDEDEDLATPDNLESILSCVEIKRSQSRTNPSADTESTRVPSPRPGLMDYYLGLRSGEYKLSPHSSSASSQNEALADIKSALDDLDLTKEEFTEDSNTTTSLDHVYNEIRKLKFAEYGLQLGSNGSISTGKTEITSTKVQVLEQVASPLSSKGSVEEGDVFMHKLQSLLTRMT